jgi:Ca-activated chloride channel family protein
VRESLATSSFAGVQFIWPSLLWLLLLAPICATVYLYARRHERSTPASLGAGFLVVLGLSCLLLALARPKVQINLPSPADQVMVVLDISASMQADDVKPSRWDVAKQTLTTMIERQPKDVRMGLVTAAATATLVAPATTDRAALIDALNTVTLQPGSAIGSGLLIGLAELLPSAGIDVQALLNAAVAPEANTDEPIWRPDPNVIRTPGSNRSVAMVLITDGDANMGPGVIEMAQLASQFGVRVYTIGIGTTEGAVVSAQGISQRVRLDAATLAEVAALTVGTYYEGASREDLTTIFNAVQTNLAFQQRQSVEATAFFLLGAMLLLLVGMGLTLVRQGRLI